MNLAGANDDCQILAEIKTSFVQQCEFVVESNVKLYSKKFGLRWNWKLSPQNFELVVGIYHTLTLLPDHLFLAICINKLGLPDFDGAKFVRHVSIVFSYYKGLISLIPSRSDLVKKIHVFFLTPRLEDDPFPIEDDVNYVNLEVQLDAVVRQLEELVKCLEAKNIGVEFFARIKLLLNFCDFVSDMCLVYRDFVLMVWFRTHATGRIDLDKEEFSRKRVCEKIRQQKSSLTKHFFEKYQNEFGAFGLFL